MSYATIQPTACVWVGDYDSLPEGPWQIGWTFFGNGFNLSTKYLTDVASIRQPITVLIPVLWQWDDGRPSKLGCTPFCIDSHTTPDVGGPKDPSKAWDVTVDMASLVIGQKPLITVHPSIDAEGCWHGFLQEGILHQ